MVFARARLVLACSLSMCSLSLGCGPSTQGDDSGGSGSGSETGTTAGPADTSDTSDESGLDDTAMQAGICGDGVLDPDEACDDGNQADADGCSHRCELSGSVSWAADLTVEPLSLAVALDVRDGDAYAGVQQYGEGIDVEMHVSRVSGEGIVLADFFDPGGLSDLDVAWQSVASTPEGDFIAGYFVSRDGISSRSVARIGFDEGIQWTASPETDGSFATTWSPYGIFVLRSNLEDDELVALRYSDEGELVGEFPMGLLMSEHHPLTEGAMPPSPLPTLRVLTQTAEGTHFSSAIVPPRGGGTAASWETSEISTIPSRTAARAFAHSTEVVVWTEHERIVIDMLDHPQPPEPRLVPGRVLVSFESGFAIVEGRRIDVFDDEGQLRWSHESTLSPKFARVDDSGGMFVLSDAGPEQNTVHLEYVVL